MELSANLCEIANYRPKACSWQPGICRYWKRPYCVGDHNPTLFLHIRTDWHRNVSPGTRTGKTVALGNLSMKQVKIETLFFFHGAQKRNPSSATSSLRHCPHEPLPWTLAISWYWGNLKNCMKPWVPNCPSFWFPTLSPVEVERDGLRVDGRHVV